MMRVSRNISLLILLLLTLNAQAGKLVEFSNQVPVTFQIFLKRTLEDFFTIQGKTSSPLHNQIFQGPVSGDTYKKWFQTRVQKIEIMPSCNLTAKIDSAGPAGVIYISKCVNFNPDDSEMFYWLSILFHEARHLEPHSAFWRHDVCVNSSGETDACDASPIGAFGLEKVLAGNILKYCLNCLTEMKVQAQEVLADSITWRKLSPSAIQKIENDVCDKCH